MPLPACRQAGTIWSLKNLIIITFLSKIAKILLESGIMNVMKKDNFRTKIVNKNFVFYIATVILLKFFTAFFIKPEKGLNFSLTVIFYFFTILLGSYLGGKYALGKRINLVIIKIITWVSLIVWCLPPFFALLVPSFVYGFISKYSTDFKYKKMYKILSMIALTLSTLISFLLVDIVKFGKADVVHFIAQILGY